MVDEGSTDGTHELLADRVREVDGAMTLVRHAADRGKLTRYRFDVEPEITAKLLRRGVEIHEAPIGYTGSSYAEGKKISWRERESWRCDPDGVVQP